MVQFIDQSESVVALVGAVLPEDASEEPGTVEVLVAEGRVRTYPAETRADLDFFVTPRPRSEVIDKLAISDSNAESLFHEMVGAKHLIEVPQGSAAVALKAFAGIRVVPQCAPIEGPGAEDGIVFMAPTTDSKVGVPISIVLAESMFEPKTHEDLPQSATRIGAVYDLEGETVARGALSGLDRLLSRGLAHLEWVSDPG